MDSTVREALSPAEKRKLFKQRYGELLLPQGFFFKAPNFFRLDMNERIVWMVAIYYGQGGHMCSLRVDVMPFQLGLSELCFHEGSMHIDGDQLLRCQKNAPKNEYIEYRFEQKFEAVYREFSENYLPQMLQVHDMAGWDALQLWLAGGAFLSYDVRRPWPNIVLGRYDQAAYHVRHRIQWLESCLPRERQQLAEDEARSAAFEAEGHKGMHPVTVAAERRSLAHSVQYSRDNLARTEAMIAERREFLSRLEPPQVEYFEAQVRQATEESEASCQAFFGKRAQRRRK